mgnify:CR=1 FL=1
MKKLKLGFQQLNAEVLTRSQLKQILGVDGSEGGGGGCGYDCTLGTKCFYSGPDGCGTATVVGGDGHGGCEWAIEITDPPPCGWA